MPCTPDGPESRPALVPQPLAAPRHSGQPQQTRSARSPSPTYEDGYYSHIGSARQGRVHVRPRTVNEPAGRYRASKYELRAAWSNATSPGAYLPPMGTWAGASGLRAPREPLRWTRACAPDGASDSYGGAG